MRSAIFFVLALAAPAVLSAQTAPAVDAATVIADARQALGGEGRIGKVQTFIANGRTRQIRGDNLVPIEFEIQVQLPDQYARRDEFPAQDAGPQTNGFRGEALIAPPQPTPPARAGGPPPPTPAQLEAQTRARVAAQKQDFARLLLGMFASSNAAFPISFTYAGQAEAPQGHAYVLDGKGPQNFAVRLFIDAQTHLPLMVSWQQIAPAPRRGGPPPAGAAAAGAGRPAGPAPAGPAPAAGAPPPSGGAPPAGAPPTAPAVGGPSSAGAASPGATPPAGAPRAGGPPAPPPAVEHRLYFADYRDVDGLKLPFRVRHAVNGDTTEETTFDRYRINGRIDPKRFEPAS